MTLRTLFCFLGCATLWAQSARFDLKTVPTRITPESLVVGDFNGDGKPDLAVSGNDSTGSGSVEILLGNGDGTFRSAGVISLGPPATRIVKADFNGDGKLDLAVSVGTNGQVTILLGKGDGSFEIPADSGARTPAAQLSGLIPGLAVGDVNGDGKPDLVLGPYTFTASDSVAVLLGKGDGTFGAAVNSPLDRIDVPKMVVADLNGDGRADVFVTGWSNTYAQRFARLLGNADGALTAPAWSTDTYPFAFGTLLTVKDLNGNGKPDVVALNYLDYPYPGKLDFWGFYDGALSVGGGGSDDIPADSSAGLNYVSMTAADVNGDGKADLLVTDPNGNLLIMWGNGDGIFQGPPQYPPASPSPTIYTGANSTFNDHWLSVTTADFRGVGKQDVVMALAGQSVVLLLNGGASPAVSSLNNAASLAVAPLVPGSLAAVFGQGLAYTSGSRQLASAGVRAAQTLFGLTIQADGVDAPLLYASADQANIQVPWEIAGQSQATLLVTRNGATQSLTLPVAAYAPGLFTMGSNGAGQAAALIATGAPVVAAPAGAYPGSRPIHAGEYLSLYGTGLGAVNSQQITNEPAACCVSTGTRPVVTVGGIPAAVQFSGLAPNLLGVYQVNIQIPQGVPAGDRIPVVLTMGATASNTVTIAIQ